MTFETKGLVDIKKAPSTAPFNKLLGFLRCVVRLLGFRDHSGSEGEGTLWPRLEITNQLPPFMTCHPSRRETEEAPRASLGPLSSLRFHCLRAVAWVKWVDEKTIRCYSSCCLSCTSVSNLFRRRALMAILPLRLEEGYYFQANTSLINRQANKHNIWKNVMSCHNRSGT